MGFIDCPSEGSWQQGSHKFFKAALEFRAHHEIGAGITNIGCKLTNLFLKAFYQFLIFDLLAFVSGDLLGKISDCLLFFVDYF